MQLNNTISIANTGNMSQLMANLKQADEQLAALLPSLGYAGSTNSINSYKLYRVTIYFMDGTNSH